MYLKSSIFSLERKYLISELQAGSVQREISQRGRSVSNSQLLVSPLIKPKPARDWVWFPHKCGDNSFVFGKSGFFPLSSPLETHEYPKIGNVSLKHVAHPHFHKICSYELKFLLLLLLVKAPRPLIDCFWALHGALKKSLAQCCCLHADLSRGRVFPLLVPTFKSSWLWQSRQMNAANLFCVSPTQQNVTVGWIKQLKSTSLILIHVLKLQPQEIAFTVKKLKDEIMAHVQIYGYAKKKYISVDCNSNSFSHKLICQVVKTEQKEM